MASLRSRRGGLAGGVGPVRDGSLPPTGAVEEEPQPSTSQQMLPPTPTPAAEPQKPAFTGVDALELGFSTGHSAAKGPKTSPKKRRQNDPSEFVAIPTPDGGLLIHSGITGLLIGPSGQNLRDIAHKTGAKLWVDNDNVQGNRKPLTFKGSPEAVDKAKDMVLAWLTAEKAKWCGDSGGAAVQGQGKDYQAADGDFPALLGDSPTGGPVAVPVGMNYASAVGGTSSNRPETTIQQESFPPLPCLPPRQPAAFDQDEVKSEVPSSVWETTAVEGEPEEAFQEPEPVRQPTPPMPEMPPLEVGGTPQQRQAHHPFLAPSPFSGMAHGIPQQQPSLLGFHSPTAKSASPINELALRFAMEVSIAEREYLRQLSMAQQKICVLEAIHSRSICVGCQSARRDVVFDCSHLTHCANCAERVTMCSLCQRGVMGKTRVLL